MRRVGGVLRDDCAVGVSCHHKSEKIRTSPKVSIRKGFRGIQSLLCLCAGVVVDDSYFCLSALHR